MINIDRRVFRHVLLVTCLSAFISFIVRGQDSSSTSKLDSLYAELDLLFTDSDSTLDYLLMVDSLLQPSSIKYHALMARVGYLSEVASAGRVEDINTFGLSAGVSYFHPTGIFADINSFYNDAYQPKYFMTSASIGYFKTFWEKLSTSLSHDFYFYNDTLASQPFNKAINFSNFWSEKYFEVGIDYGFLYGNDQAHRLTGIGNLRKRWEFNGFIDAITVFPGVNLQWGNADIVFYKQSDSPVRDLLLIINNEQFPSLERSQNLFLGKLLQEERYAASALFLRRNGFSEEQIQTIINQYDNSQLSAVNTFGLMNVSLQFPVSISFSSFSMLLNYSHNFPQSLPGETFEYENNGFISLSFSYFLFKSSYSKNLNRLFEK